MELINQPTNPINMNKITKLILAGGVAMAFVGLQTSQAMNINVDEILAPGDVDASELSGTVDMTLSGDGSTLTITLVNTSSDAAGSGAGVLLTGIGFNLPGWAKIDGGSVSMAGSTAVNFSAPVDNNVSSEWGYDDGGLNSGALQGAAGTINTAVSSMESQTTDQFAPGSLVNPPNLDGPDMGLISANESDGQGNGVEAIMDSIVITLDIVYANGKTLDLGDINNKGWVALTFGSPDGGTSVPDASSALALLGLALMGLEGVRRRFSK